MNGFPLSSFESIQSPKMFQEQNITGLMDLNIFLIGAGSVAGAKMLPENQFF